MWPDDCGESLRVLPGLSHDTPSSTRACGRSISRSTVESSPGADIQPCFIIPNGSTVLGIGCSLESPIYTMNASSLLSNDSEGKVFVSSPALQARVRHTSTISPLPINTYLQGLVAATNILPPIDR